MDQDVSIHLFALRHDAGFWTNTPVSSLSSRLRPIDADLADAFRGAADVALVRADLMSPSVLATLSSEADVTVIVADPAAAARHSGSEDLLATLWQAAPAVAALTCDSLLDAGAVLVRAPQAGLPLSSSLGDPLTVAVARLVAGGASVQSKVLHPPLEISPAESPSSLTPSPARAPHWLSRLTDRLDMKRLLGNVRSPADAVAVRAGLLLWHDLLDESHAASQSIEGEGRRRAGDYWHAIMHRREPDYGNAKYWFRRVGPQPVFEQLAFRARFICDAAGEPGARLLGRVVPNGRWDPFAFVDACADARRSGDAESDLLLRRLQSDEMLLLLQQTCDDART